MARLIHSEMDLQQLKFISSWLVTRLDKKENRLIACIILVHKISREAFLVTEA